MVDADELHGLAGDAVGALRGAVPPQRAQHDVLAHGELPEWLWNLEGARKAETRHLVRLGACDRMVEEPDIAARRRDRASNQIEQRALAGAVRTDQADDLARLDGERHVAHGPERVELTADAFDPQHQLVFLFVNAAQPRAIAPDIPDGK